MWGFGDLVRELRVDPEQVQRRFGISPGAEHEDDALISVVAVAAEAAAGARDEDDLVGERITLHVRDHACARLTRYRCGAA